MLLVLVVVGRRRSSRRGDFALGDCHALLRQGHVPFGSVPLDSEATHPGRGAARSHVRPLARFGRPAASAAALAAASAFAFAASAAASAPAAASAAASAFGRPWL